MQAKKEEKKNSFLDNSSLKQSRQGTRGLLTSSPQPLWHSHSMCLWRYFSYPHHHLCQSGQITEKKQILWMDYLVPCFMKENSKLTLLTYFIFSGKSRSKQYLCIGFFLCVHLCTCILLYSNVSAYLSNSLPVRE